jgi:hypothetical protein
MSVRDRVSDFFVFVSLDNNPNHSSGTLQLSLPFPISGLSIIKSQHRMVCGSTEE